MPLERVPHYGKANNWRAVTFGRTDGDAQLFTWDDESSKPFSPTNLRFPTDATATWTYRGRLIDSGFPDYVELPELEAESSYYIARRLTTVFVADTTRFVTTATASISYFATYWLEVVAYRNSGPTSRAALLLKT